MLRRQAGLLARIIAIVVAGASALLMPLSAKAQSQYPDRPVRVIHPFAAGGGSDVVLRIVMQELAQSTGKTFVVENKPGAGGRLGYDTGAKANPDGYTLVTSETTYTMLPGLFGDKLTWNPNTDIVPVTTFARVPMVVVVSPNLKVTTLEQFIALAKSQPGKLTYGSSGFGSINHIVGELFKRDAKVDIVHVPFKGGAEMVVGLLNGSVDMIIQSPVAVASNVKNGTMTALAVAAPKRIAVLPNVPTTIEAGLPSFVVGNWFGVAAPKGTPQAEIDWLHREISKVVMTPESEQRFDKLGAIPFSISPPELGKLMQDEMTLWSGVIKESHIEAK